MDDDDIVVVQRLLRIQRQTDQIRHEQSDHGLFALAVEELAAQTVKAAGAPRHRLRHADGGQGIAVLAKADDDGVDGGETRGKMQFKGAAFARPGLWSINR